MARPRFRSIGIFGFALIAGLVAAWAAHEHIQMREQEIARQAEVPVLERLAVAVDLPAGTPLQLNHLGARDVPHPWVPENSFEVDAADQVVGQRLSVDLKQGDVLLSAHIRADEAKPAVSNMVPPGRRAVTLPVSEIQGASGLLRVDDLIDLYVSFVHQGQQVTAALAQGVRVLALHGDSVPAVVTLDASEQDAIKLVAARHVGRMTAMLRRAGDSLVSGATRTGDLAALIGLERPSTALAPEPLATPIRVPVLYGDRADTHASVSGMTLAEPRRATALTEKPGSPAKSLTEFQQ